MTTTYDPFIPADGTDQRRYDGRRRAEEPDGGSAWGAEPRWEPQYQPPQQYAEPRWEPEPQQQRWDPEPAPAPQPRAWQTGAFPVTPEVAEPGRARGGAPKGLVKPLLAGLVAVLVAVAGWQAYRIESMSSDNATMHSVLAAEKSRTDQLQKEMAGVFDPEAVSSKALPSVFRVRAGEFTGTAFAVGDGPKAGQSALLTNFHVVESVYNAGTRKVFLERGNDELSATITKVNKTKDLALLTVSKKITGLVAATATVQPGQQVVVVGAPLGLEDTVTTGVVSAYRQEANGPTVQFDAPINPGNSGGPVVAANDQVLGLATAKAKDAEGIGLAIPIKTACDAFPGVC